MKTYSISEVAKKMDLTIYTLRYYDKEGLIPAVKRTAGGVRAFSDADIKALKFIQCLKSTGLTIKEIKQYVKWCAEGDVTLRQRYSLVVEQKPGLKKARKASQFSKR